MTKVPPKIDLLPEHLIDQIKAGEVIERPGNLIKEIMENAVDAGASKIELTLRNNGLDLISLKDNGHGMRFDDLPLAFSRHTTSKISRFEDLYRLRSFGFRGEALASIAAISKLQCLSKTSDSVASSELRIEGGETIFHGERHTSSALQGTEIVIQDLFFNTPARLKFIQSQQAEKTFIRKVIFAFILSHSEIEFQIKIDDNEKNLYPARESMLERIQDLFPKAQDSILHSQRFYEENELDLFLIPGPFKAPLKFQNIYINNRYILDKQLHRVMTNSLEASFGSDDFHYVAFFHLPPDRIDVNVHPNKTIIKVMEMSKMISLLSSTIKEIGGRRSEREPTVLPTIQDPQAPFTPTFFDGMNPVPSVLQERQQYNMEGLFSPHNLPEKSTPDFIWIGAYFLKSFSGKWLGVSPHKLLQNYTNQRLKALGPTIPLLVSEPFPAKGVRKEVIKKLSDSGLELEYLGAETIVLRGIPDWMNGFPLNEVVRLLLQEKSFSELTFNPLDWSQSTWDEMIEFFSIDELINQRIVVDLEQVFREKLR